MKRITCLICPLDGERLERSDAQLRCQHGHSFDVARRGYVNLLPPQFKRSKQPGDSKEMVEARHRFLSAGFYHALAELLASMSAVKPEVALLDAGCGEGYYLRQLQELSPHITWHVSGLDVSKPAVDLAAKHHKGCCWMVASNAKIPLPDESVDVLWCVFGFPQGDEFVRVLKPGGRLIQVDAGSEHLMELREVIYPEVKIKQPPALIDHPSLSAGRRECIQEVMSLDQHNIADLMLMTPHLFKASKVGRDKALSLSRLECRTHMVLRELIKVPC